MCTDARHVRVSPRERSIILALAAGRSNKQISSVVGISRGHVANKLAAMYRATDTNTRAGLISWAYRTGLLQGARASE